VPLESCRAQEVEVRVLQVIVAASLMALCAVATGHAEKRVALAIGNDRYTNLPAGEQLQKAVNDARAVGNALRQIGFEVIPGAENLGRRALVGKLNELVQRLSPGDMAVFFFSGHGLALDGVNYILPADVPDIAVGQETSLKAEAVSEQYIISELTGRGVRVAVVVLDACRTNPFSRSGAKGVGGEKGLAPPPQVKGVFSLYAARGGQAARDRLYDGDPSPNSVFSRVLVPALARPGIDLATLAIEVREEVARVAQSAGYDQQPAYYDETSGGRVYLAAAQPAAKPVPAPPAKMPEAPGTAASTGLPDRILGDVNGYLQILAIDTPLTDWEPVAARVSMVRGVRLAAPVVEGSAVASSPSNANGVLVRGIRGADLARLGTIANNIQAGSLEDFDQGQGIAIGQRLAEQLALTVGDSLTLVSQRRAVMPMGMTPRIKPYKIAAIFKNGMSEYDAALVFMPLKEALAYFNRDGDVTAIAVYVDDPDRVQVQAFRRLIADAAQRPIYMRGP
jgi:Caspase domain/MacB-like periplasmic core domain